MRRRTVLTRSDRGLRGGWAGRPSRALLAGCLAWALGAAAPAAEPAGRALLEQYQQALRTARDQGRDTGAAESLATRSRQAARQGDQPAAGQLLQEAIAALGKAAPRGTEALPAPEPGPAQPVFFLAFTHHYNGPGGYYPTPQEVRELGSFFHQQRIPGTLFFDGILVERLLKEDPELLADIRQWGLPIGYHGEETHGPYPVASELLGEVRVLPEAQGYRGPWSLTSGVPWAEAVRRVEERYSHARAYRLDPETRRVDRRQPVETDLSRAGGLRLVQQALGKDVSMMTSHALESAPEGFAFRRLSAFAFDQPAVPVAAHALRIFRAEALMDRLMAVAGARETIFWFMGRLMSKGDDDGEAGATAMGLRRTTEGLDRSRPRLLLVGFSHFDERRATEAVRFVSERFLPANPGSAWVSGETIMAHFEAEKDGALGPADLDALAAATVGTWSGRPPDQVVASAGRVFSLCDVFEALVRGAVTAGAGGAVVLHALYGPITEDDRPCLRGPVSLERADVARAAARVVAEWERQAAAERFVPATVTVGRETLNAAEFLYVLAATRNAAGGAGPEARPARSFPPYADALDELFTPRTRQPLCYTKGQLWTVKPARLRPASDSRAATPAEPARGPVQPPVAATGGEGPFRLVFAANLDSSEPCHRDHPGGGDLYTVRYDPGTGTASDLRRLTRTAGLAEWFPALAPDGRHVVYDAEEATPIGRPRHGLRLLDLEDGRDAALLADARCPAFSADGRALYFSRQGRDQRGLCRADLDARAAKLGPLQPIAVPGAGRELIEDPAPLPDGSGIVFHHKDDPRRGAAVACLSAGGTGLVPLTPFDGCGHAAVAPDGSAVVCSRSRDGAVIVIPRSPEGWGVPQRLPLPAAPADWARLDPRLGASREVRHSYLEWVAPKWLVLTSHGAEGDHDFRCARLFLVHLEGDGQAPRVLDVSSAVERLAGATGKDFCSGDAVPVR